MKLYFVCLASLLSLPASAALIVQQIEAPINGGSAVDPAAFPGIKFIADSSGVSTHAQTVGEKFYGVGSPAAGTVGTVYETSADSFLQSLRARSSVGKASAPVKFPKGVVVSNGSFVAGFGTPSADLDAVRRLDSLIAKSNVTFVAGAATGPGFSGDNLPWSARNVIAVHGEDSSTPFDPTQGQLWRPHADVYLPGESSYATAEVSSMAAALIAQSPKDAKHDVVTRSLIMTGADRTGHYGAELANHLDPVYGAGEASFNTSQRVLQAGEDRTLSVKKSAIKAKSGAFDASAGWSYLKVGKAAQDAVIFQATSPIHHLDATLNWDVTSKLGGSSIDTSDRATSVPDLALSVYSLVATSKGFTLGDLLYTSDVTDDNVEHLDINGDLPVGNYAFVLRGDPKLTTAAGFSWEADSTAPQAAPMSSIIAVPEPSLGSALTILAMGFSSRRRRRA